MADTIATFEEECKKYPPQYTPEWFARALESIGGSEMHDLTTAPRLLAARKISRIVEAIPLEITETSPPIIEQPAQVEQVAQVTAGYVDTSSDVISDESEQATPAAPAASVPVALDTTSLVLDDLQVIEQTAPVPASVKDAVGEFAMGWGTLFEPLLCEYIARTLHVDIRCRSASYFNGSFRYSPDGAFIDALKAYVLLEMKNPALRIWPGFAANPNSLADPSTLVSNPRGVPTHYLPQLQAGMRLMPFIQYALYTEAIYRRATNPGGYITAVGMQRMIGLRDVAEQYKATRGTPCLDCGVIGFYYSRAPPRNVPINFGSRANDEELIRAITHMRCDDPFVPAYFGSTGLPFANKSEIPRESGGLILYGYMPWNLIGIHAERVDRDEAAIPRAVLDNADSIIASVRECMGASRAVIEGVLARVRQLAVDSRDSPRIIADIDAIIAKCRAHLDKCASASDKKEQ